MRRKAHVRFGGRAEETGEPKDSHCASARPNHTHVALLIEQGAHPQLIASRLGHTSVRTVLDVYGHLFEGLDRNLADSLHDPSEGPSAYYLPTSSRTRVVDFPTKSQKPPLSRGFSGGR